METVIMNSCSNCWQSGEAAEGLSGAFPGTKMQTTTPGSVSWQCNGFRLSQVLLRGNIPVAERGIYLCDQ
ncbi:hypothetical protein [Shewanella sp. NFH-SH190041]|uniref:hypothetical protein n=1 Tax=Shewanella sp. NFH-SH190041 TaxID=2950245 RepID=UPI0021C36F83|nr:hypothetical protein [Shewanella sp. NFH-SH190041]